jgi:hypothetical protein
MKVWSWTPVQGLSVTGRLNFCYDNSNLPGAFTEGSKSFGFPEVAWEKTRGSLAVLRMLWRPAA